MKTRILLATAVLCVAPLAAQAQSSSWTGFYIGINGGYGWGNSTQTDTVLPTLTSIPPPPPPPPPDDGSYGLSGGFIGGGAGFNWVFDSLGTGSTARVLVGLEGDYAWSGIKGSSGFCGGNHECGTRLNSFGTVRGRVGALIGNTLPYVTGGLALGDIYAYDVTGGSGSSFRAGWTVGGGVEQRFEGTWSAWSARIEYLYADFGSTTYFTLPGRTPENVSLTTNIIRLGINYRLN